MFTPILGAWSDTLSVTDYYSEYDADIWNKGDSAYINRGWCRLEMFLAANLPVDRKSAQYRKLKGGLKFHIQRGRRPHFLFGTTEMLNNRSPIILPPLHNLYLERYHPSNGFVSANDSGDARSRILNKLISETSTTELKYEGQTMKGVMHGMGRLTYANGDIYSGSWENDKRSGKGELRTSQGSTLKGMWENDAIHGKHEITFLSTDWWKI
jgi:hypothetical protein